VTAPEAGAVPVERSFDTTRIASDRAQLDETWRRPGGLIGWLSDVDHHTIAKRYIVTAFVFFLLGGVEAAMMRMQLARPENKILGPDLYNQFFTMHGTTMMFLFAVPIMTAIGLYLVPMMVGTRNVAFPRLNAFGYYVYLIGGLLLYVSFFVNTGPDAGWFNYVPLAGPQYSPGKRIDVWAQTITFTEISALVTAIEIIATVFKLRAPGMTLNRMPLFVWSQLVVSFMIIFAMPAVATASMLLAMDRLVDTHFFNPAEGGDALLWQHLFWFFGHPEVYIIFIPGLGIVSSIVAPATKRAIFGYPVMVLSLIATGFLGFGLWVHHMFATPIPIVGQSLFTAASMSISIPTGVQISCWIATIWASRPRFTVSFLYIIGFFVIFIIGGLTGVMIATVPFDLQAHDTFFVVAHLHYVLIGGAVFPLFGAFYHWFPKVTGKMLSERWGKVQFWLFFIGVNVTFFPQHQLGLNGMTRRIYTYLAETGWGPLNLLSTIGAVTIALSMILFLVIVTMALRSRQTASENPWGAETLEWLTPSPPPVYNFVNIPIVEGRSALWERSPEQPVVTGLATTFRESLVTTVMDAEPVQRHTDPEPTIAPFLTALAVGVLFISLLFTPWGAVVGFAAVLIPAALWAREGVKPDPEPEPEGA
jgi:cytochrome c oxidase subunit I+III